MATWTSHVDLLIFYRPEDFSPVDNVKLLHYPWSLRPHIKCRISLTAVGWTPFQVVQAAISPFFTAHRRDIQLIRQRIGSVDGRTVAEGTSDDDEVEEKEERKMFYTIEGKKYSWEETKMRRLELIAEGDVLICGGHQRTVLMIRA